MRTTCVAKVEIEKSPSEKYITSFRPFHALATKKNKTLGD